MFIENVAYVVRRDSPKARELISDLLRDLIFTCGTTPHSHSYAVSVFVGTCKVLRECCALLLATCSVHVYIQSRKIPHLKSQQMLR